jgi:hypothetical protein
MTSYFFIAVSTRENLDLCTKYSLAGFTSNVNGAWAFSEINKGDFVSFLYGAKAYNLYEVVAKEAIKNSESLPPWKPLTFRESGRTYHFPFRLKLKPIRRFEESIVRPGFAYIAENLLLRGGYRKTHFQADQTTLQYVSQISEVFRDEVEELKLPPYETFIPRFVRSRYTTPPEVFQFKEVILQSLIRQHLSNERLDRFFKLIGCEDLHYKDFEVLGEKALSQGHVDILIKDSQPRGYSRQIVLEIKLGKATNRDMNQLRSYMNEIGDECICGVLIAERISSNVPPPNICAIIYEFEGVDLTRPYTFEELLSAIRISPQLRN